MEKINNYYYFEDRYCYYGYLSAKEIEREKINHGKLLAISNYSLPKNSIIWLGLSTRAVNSLWRNGFTTIEDAIERKDDIARIRNVGKKTEKEIIEKLAIYQKGE